MQRIIYLFFLKTIIALITSAQNINCRRPFTIKNDFEILPSTYPLMTAHKPVKPVKKIAQQSNSTKKIEKPNVNIVNRKTIPKTKIKIYAGIWTHLIIIFAIEILREFQFLQIPKTKKMILQASETMKNKKR